MKKMNYEAPVAEMIELQASMVLMNSGDYQEPSINVNTPSPIDDPWS